MQFIRMWFFGFFAARNETVQRNGSVEKSPAGTPRIPRETE